MSHWSQSVQRMAGFLDRLSEWTGRAVAWLTLLMVVDQFAVVVLRDLFDYGSIAMQESVMYLYALVFMLGSAYTLKRGGHVRVDIFYRGMRPSRRAWVDLLGTLVFLIPLFLFILWECWSYVLSSWASLEGSQQTAGLPALYLLKTVLLVMPVLMLLQGVALAAHNLLFLAGYGAAAACEDEAEV